MQTMSESSIRRMVQKVLEAELGGADGGLFSDERARSFFAQLKTLVNSCFHALHDAVVSAYPDGPERQRRLRKGLAFIASEKNEAMSRDELQKALAEFPSITDDYHRAMVRFAQCVLLKLSPTTKIECPSFETFLFRLYRRIATSVEVNSGRFFTMSYLEQDIFLKDMVRLNMSACMSVRNTTTSRPAVSDILPSDSVSNVSARDKNAESARRLRERTKDRSTFQNALSAATHQSSSESSSPSSTSDDESSVGSQPLTKTRLNRHRSHHNAPVPPVMAPRAELPRRIPEDDENEERVVEIMTGNQGPFAPMPRRPPPGRSRLVSQSRASSQVAASDLLCASDDESS